MIAARGVKSTGVLLAAILATLFLTTSHAFATCSSPSGNEGDTWYTSLTHQLVYCNGNNWVAMGENSAVSFGTLTSADFCTATSGTAIQCTTGYTGTLSGSSVVLSISPTLTGTVTGANSTWSGQVAIGTTTTSGALNINGTVTATTFSGSGASLTSIGTTNLSAITGIPSNTTFLAGNGTWEAIGSGGGVTGFGFTTNDFCTANSTSGIVCSTAQIGLTSQVTGVLPIANGGTNTNTQTTNGVAYYNGTALTSGSGFVYSGGQVGIGTATPLSVFNTYGGAISDVQSIGVTSTNGVVLANLTAAANAATLYIANAPAAGALRSLCHRHGSL